MISRRDQVQIACRTWVDTKVKVMTRGMASVSCGTLRDASVNGYMTMKGTELTSPGEPPPTSAAGPGSCKAYFERVDGG